MKINSAEIEHPGVIGVHSFGVNGVHEVGLIGLECHGAMQQVKMKKQQYDCISDKGLTLIQKRILLWLIMMCKGRELRIISIYKKIGAVVGINPRAAGVHLKALEKKGLIVTALIYRIGTRQIIGKRIAVTKYAPPLTSLELNLKMTEAEKLKRLEMAKKYEQTMEMWRNGLL